MKSKCREKKKHRENKKSMLFVPLIHFDRHIVCAREWYSIFCCCCCCCFLPTNFRSFPHLHTQFPYFRLFSSIERNWTWTFKLNWKWYIFFSISLALLFPSIASKMRAKWRKKSNIPNPSPIKSPRKRRYFKAIEIEWVRTCTVRIVLDVIRWPKCKIMRGGPRISAEITFNAM